MAVAYERFQNDPVEAQSLQSSDSDDPSISSDQILVIDGADGADTTPHDGRIERIHNFLQNKWPYKSSILQLVLGLVLVGLGTAQIIILPLFDDHNNFGVRIDSSNCYGIGEWIGVIFVIGGCVGLRAAIHKSLLSVYVYFGVIVFELFAHVAAFLLLIIAYSKNWTTMSGLGGDKVLYYVHLSVMLCVLFGFFVVIYAFLQYYEDVMCGELQCCKRLVHCLLPCLCPRAVQGHELIDENDERPPSLPV